MTLVQRNSKRRKPLVAVFAIFAIVLGGCSRSDPATKDAAKRGDSVPVTIIPVLQRDVPLDLEAIGNVEAYSTVSVRSQVNGPLLKVHFREGDYVKKGDLLFSIDPSPFEAAVREAEANLARSEAMQGQADATLKRDQAQLRYAQAQAERYQTLLKEGISSKEQVDQMVSAADTSKEVIRVDEAAIVSARASVVAVRAQLENAKILFGYTVIRSPIDGRTGNLAVKAGNLVTANQMELIAINQLQPIYVTFAVPESNLSDIKKYSARGKLPVTALPQDGVSEPESGELTFIDNNVDPSTGTIKLKATFANADHMLWPGQYVRARLRLAMKTGASVVLGQAVQEGQEGQFVYVVKPDMSVEARPVKLGARTGQEVVIDSGLQAGEKVVAEGQLRLAPGMKVRQREAGGGQRSGPRGADGQPEERKGPRGERKKS